MKIYGDPRQPNPRRVRIFLAEKGIEVPFEPLDIVKEEHKTPAMTALNPVQRVPVLVLDDGTAISETMAICRYFEALHPQPALFGTTALEIANIEMWQRRAELNLLLSIAQVFRHSHPAMATLEKPQVPDWAEANRPRVIESIRVFDAALKDRPYVAGDVFSAADITAYVAADFMRPARLTIPEDAIHFLRWQAHVKQRPSITPVAR
jgi:glutathione S-transferase